MTQAILNALEPRAGYKFDSAQWHLLELLFNSTLDCAAVLDRQFKFIYLNRAFALAAQSGVAEMIGCSGFSILAPSLEPRFVNVLRTGVPATERSRLFGETGGDAPARDWDWRVAPVLGSDGEVELLILSIGNAAIKAEAGETEQLSVATRQIGLLSRQLADLPEMERKRMARELHDEIGQSLFSIKLALEAGISTTQGVTHDRLLAALGTTVDIMGSVTKMSQDLRPAMLDDLGLLPALLWLISRHEVLTGLRASLRHGGLELRLGREIETAAYRIVQEALTNISRHAGVSEATIIVYRTARGLMIKIEDLGAGFEEAEPAVKRRGSGLTGMRERAQVLGGVLQIDTELGRGTAISVEIPLDGPMSAAAGDEP